MILFATHNRGSRRYAGLWLAALLLALIAVGLVACSRYTSPQPTLTSSADIRPGELPRAMFLPPDQVPTRKQQWALLASIHQDPRDDNRLVLFYTRKSIPKENRASGADQANNDYWNREHLWPRSLGLKNTLADRDMHNLVAVDRSVNTSRGNKLFRATRQAHHECTLCNTDLESWEPPDDVKGDVARVAFYMAVVYGQANTDIAPLVLTRAAATNTDQGHFGDLDTLLAWHCHDPVSSFETRRDNLIAEAQGNHNPFVLDPQLANRLFHYRCQ